MTGGKVRGIAAVCLVTVLLCFAAGGVYFREKGNRIKEMERINVSNGLYNYVEAMKTYGSNLQILTFEKEDLVYSYKLHEALGMIKSGSASLDGKTYGRLLPEDLTQGLKELSVQLSNFTYRFMDGYPFQTAEMDAAALKMAREVMRTADILDSVLDAGETGPWIRNPADGDDWMLDKGYRINAESADEALESIKRLLEENEKLVISIGWK